MAERPGTTHSVKCQPPYFVDVLSGRKTFEVRLDDRGYREGDTLHLMEWADGKYTGFECDRLITYVLRDAEGFGLAPGYVVMELA